MLNYLNWRYTGTEMIHGALIMGQRDRCSGFYWERWRVFFPLASWFLWEMIKNNRWAPLYLSDRHWFPDPGTPDQGPWCPLTRDTHLILLSVLFFLSLQNRSAGYWVISWPGGHLWENAAVKPFFFSFFFHVFSSFCPPAGRCGCVCFTSSNEAGMYGQR